MQERQKRSQGSQAWSPLKAPHKALKQSLGTGPVVATGPDLPTHFAEHTTLLAY